MDVGGSNSNQVGAVKALAFEPPTVKLVLDGATATRTAEFSLVATLQNDSTAKVSAESLQFDRPDLAASKNGSPVVLTATGAVAGKGTLHAVFGGLEATADLDVQLVEKHVDGAIPADVVTALDAGGAQDPALTALLLSCAGIGAACEAAGDCCNSSVVSCVEKKCKVKVVK